jgi:hypothetical protein
MNQKILPPEEYETIDFDTITFRVTSYVLNDTAHIMLEQDILFAILVEMWKIEKSLTLEEEVMQKITTIQNDTVGKLLVNITEAAFYISLTLRRYANTYQISKLALKFLVSIALSDDTVLLRIQNVLNQIVYYSSQSNNQIDSLQNNFLNNWNQLLIDDTSGNGRLHIVHNVNTDFINKYEQDTFMHAWLDHLLGEETEFGKGSDTILAPMPRTDSARYQQYSKKISFQPKKK